MIGIFIADVIKADYFEQKSMIWNFVLLIRDPFKKLSSMNSKIRIESQECISIIKSHWSLDLIKTVYWVTYDTWFYRNLIKTARIIWKSLNFFAIKTFIQ